MVCMSFSRMSKQHPIAANTGDMLDAYQMLTPTSSIVVLCITDKDGSNNALVETICKNWAHHHS